MENQDLKRCPGTPAKGMPWFKLSEPHHLEATAQNFSSDISAGDGLNTKCRTCANAYRTSRNPYGPQIDPMKKRCTGTTAKRMKWLTLVEPHYDYRRNFGRDSKTTDGLNPRCKNCANAYATSRTPFGPSFPPDVRRCIGFEGHHYVAISEFTSARKRPSGLNDICKKCQSLSHKNYRKANPEVFRAKTQRRNDRLRSQPNENVSKERLLEIHGSECYLCGKPVPENIGDWDMEHVIPTSRGQLGTTYENCRVAHASCNRSKGPKTYFEYEIQRSTHYVTIENLYLFNEVYVWHVQTFWEDFARNHSTK